MLCDMTDIPVIILAKDAKVHFGRCLERWRDLTPPPMRWQARLSSRARGKCRSEDLANKRSGLIGVSSCSNSV